MVGDVLEALGRVTRLEGVIVVTAEAAAVDAAGAASMEDGRGSRTAGGRRPLVEVVPDPSEAGQSAAASLGIRAAVTRGAERVLLVPGDCPAIDPAEVEALLAPREAGVGIVPDRHGTGTNALLLAPPTAIAPAFGPGPFPPPPPPRPPPPATRRSPAVRAGSSSCPRSGSTSTPPATSPRCAAR